MSSLTSKQYDQAIALCKDIYLKKMRDYGSAWRILRPSSLTDQIFIKAQRIRSIEEKGAQKVMEGVESEFVGIVNYAVMALIQIGLHSDAPMELSPDDGLKYYEENVQKVKSLMMDKNHDYGEAWREMSQESFVDLILAKILRIKQIISNEGNTIISEGIDANFFDILNYAVFALILIDEGRQPK